jgi:predicted N-formylglutamate amidohydrolase
LDRIEFSQSLPPMNEAPKPLLGPTDPRPVTVDNAEGASPFLLVADHAGNFIPRTLERLGLTEADLQRHIGWDIGIAGLGRLLADALDAVLIRQNYSRLVIDANRPPASASSIPEFSELTPIPGNVGLDDSSKAARAREIFWPYHERIEAELESRRRSGRPTVLIALHSFTPIFKGVARPWQAAVLYNRDRRLSDSLLALLKRQSALVVGDNEPYFVSDMTDYTIPVHGERHGLHHALIEIRQDLIADESGQRGWAALLADLLPQAHAAVGKR